MSVPNQNHIIIKKEPCNKENLYTTINMYALEDAMRDLSGESFKLWVYFSKNQDNYSFDLSQKAAEQCGIKKTTYYRTKNELIKKGYLQPKQQGSNIYYFTEIAFSQNGNEEDIEEWAISENGKNYSQYGKEREEIKEIKKEKEKYIDQYGKNYSQNGKDFSGNKTNFSHIEQRNNINNTDKIKNNTIKISGKAAKKLCKECLRLLREIKKDLDNGEFDKNEYTKQKIYELGNFLEKSIDQKDEEDLHRIISYYWNCIYK